jgi:hypothetical protein
MRTAIIILALLVLSPPALAQFECYHHYSSPHYFNYYWAMERQALALEGIQRSLERREWERQAEKFAELARIRAESEALTFQVHDRKYQEAKDAAFDAIAKMEQKGLKNEVRSERIARHYKWKQYRKMQRYRYDRWGIP